MNFLTIGIPVNDNRDASVAPAANKDVPEEAVSPDVFSEFTSFPLVTPTDYLFVSVNSHDFFVMVTLLWSEHVKTTRSSRPKKHEETKNTPNAVKVLAMTRATFVTTALSAHGYQSSYVPGQASGPGMQISWPGFPFVLSLILKFNVLTLIHYIPQ